MICPNCGRELRDGIAVCPSCGGPIRLRRRRELSPSSSKSVNNDSSAKMKAEIPAGVRLQKKIRNEGRRPVRHAPLRSYKRTDSAPADLHPAKYRKSHRRLIIAATVVFAAVVVIVTATFVTLFTQPDGKIMMAQWGWKAADDDSYITLARTYYETGRYDMALEKLDFVLERSPENAEALLLKGQCYTEKGDLDIAVEIYTSMINGVAKGYPNAYRNLIKIYQQQGYNAEALALMKQADENTVGTTDFQIMLKEYTPKSPEFNLTEGRYNEDIDVTIKIPEGETVYYTTDGTDPSESGMIYTADTKIHVSEGKMTVKAIGFTDNGTPSEQISANYTVVIPTPAAPKSNYQSGVYKKAPKVTLRPGSEDAKENKHIVAIYYTLDGRQATTESTKYTEPIQLPTGNCTLRAISVSDNGKISYEMKVTYSVEGNLKKMFGSSDTFKGMELYKTGYNSFVKTWGQPDSYNVLPESEWYAADSESTEAVYSWGTARFAKKPNGNIVLYYLDTNNSKMTAPRSTKVGMTSTAVMEKFRDLGQAALDSDGNRLLYNWNSAGYQFGTFRKEEDGGYAVHYYYPVDDNHTIFVELSYYLDGAGNVERILWQRYISEV